MSNESIITMWKVNDGWVSDYDRSQFPEEFREYLPEGRTSNTDDAHKLKTELHFPVDGLGVFTLTVHVLKSQISWNELTKNLLEAATFFPTKNADVLCSDNLSIVSDGGLSTGSTLFSGKYTHVYFTIIRSIDTNGTPTFTTASHWNKEGAQEKSGRAVITRAPSYAWKDN